jgi:hypothetical protein
MSFEDFERGYLLPKGCKDLIDVIGLLPRPELKGFLKVPLVHSTPHTGIFHKPGSPASATKGDLFVSDHTTVRELAALLGQKPFKIIADAMQLGVFATVNQSLGFKASAQIAEKYGYAAKRTA